MAYFTEEEVRAKGKAYVRRLRLKAQRDPNSLTAEDRNILRAVDKERMAVGRKMAELTNEWATAVKTYNKYAGQKYRLVMGVKPEDVDQSALAKVQKKLDAAQKEVVRTKSARETFAKKHNLEAATLTIKQQIKAGFKVEAVERKKMVPEVRAAIQEAMERIGFSFSITNAYQQQGAGDTDFIWGTTATSIAPKFAGQLEQSLKAGKRFTNKKLLIIVEQGKIGFMLKTK